MRDIKIERQISSTKVFNVVNSIPNMLFKPNSKESKCSKLYMKILLDSTLFVAGGMLHGRFELNCVSSNCVKLSEISVHLSGNEEITDSGYESTQNFLSSEITFQGHRMPPSNAVHGPCMDGYWLAKKSKTYFHFKFKLPEDAPSSFSFQRITCLRYIVTGLCNFEYHGRKGVMTVMTEATILENIPKAIMDESTPLKATTKAYPLGSPFLSKKGKIKLSALLQRSSFVSGDNLYVAIKVKNDSNRKIRGIKLALLREVLVLQPGGVQGVKCLCETVAKSNFSKKEYTFRPGDDRTILLHIYIPPFVRTVKSTSLAEIICFLTISLRTGLLSKPLVLEFPVTIYHPASIEPPPDLDYSFSNSTKKTKFSLPYHGNHLATITKNKGMKYNIYQQSKMDQIPLINGSRILPWSEDTELPMGPPSEELQQGNENWLESNGIRNKDPNDHDQETGCSEIPPVWPTQYTINKSQILSIEREEILEEHSKVWEYCEWNEQDEKEMDLSIFEKSYDLVEISNAQNEAIRLVYENAAIESSFKMKMKPSINERNQSQSLRSNSLKSLRQYKPLPCIPPSA